MIRCYENFRDNLDINNLSRYWVEFLPGWRYTNIYLILNIQNTDYSLRISYFSYPECPIFNELLFIIN